MSLATLKRIALMVRHEMERTRVGRMDEERGYVIESDLGGLCYVSSSRIVCIARRRGICGARVFSSGGHEYVRWGAWIIDVTATQFGTQYKPVEVIRLDGQKLPEHWRDREEIPATRTGQRGNS